MSFLQSIRGVAARAVGMPRQVTEDEFKQWRREALDPAVRSGACYVPMPGLEDSRHYRDKQNRHHLGRYEWAAQLIRADRTAERILDCACGVGYGAAKLAAVAQAVDAVDCFDSAIRVARSRYNAPNICWHQFDVKDLRKQFEPDSFDAIVSFQTIECVENDIQFLDDLVFLLKPGGRLLIDTPVRKHRVDNPQNAHHRRNYSVEEWLDMLIPRFDSVQAFESLPKREALERIGMPSRGSIACCAKA